MEEGGLALDAALFDAVAGDDVRPAGLRHGIAALSASTNANLDEAMVEEARQRAEARLREKISAEEVASVNASLARSLAQLHVKRRRRT